MIPSQIQSDGGKARARVLTPEKRKAIASSGGIATAARRTKKQRQQAARKAAKARWEK